MLEEEDMSPEFFYMGSHTGNGLDNIGFAYQDINVEGTVNQTDTRIRYKEETQNEFGQD